MKSGFYVIKDGMFLIAKGFLTYNDPDAWSAKRCFDAQHEGVWSARAAARKYGAEVVNIDNGNVHHLVNGKWHIRKAENGQSR